MSKGKNGGTGFHLGILAALFWSVHFPLLHNFVSESTPLAVFYFHTLFWASIASMTLLIITGRTDELSLINRRSGTLFLLVLTGGYGMWMTMAAAHTAGGKTVELLFYSGPLLLVFLSMFPRGGVRRGRLVMALAGFTGALFILHNMHGISVPRFYPFVIALASALCWAVFSFVAATLVRKTETLPILVLTLCVSTVCFLLTCLVMGMDILAIGREEILVSIAAGGLSIAVAYGLWMKCMEVQSSPANAATWWYGALIFGAAWYYFFLDSPVGWPGIIGAVIIVFSFKTASGGKERTESILGDLMAKGG